MEIGKDAKSSVDDEEAYVLVEFAGINLEELLKSDPPPVFKMLGIHESSTILQIGPHVYTGKLQNSHTTNLFFETTNFDAEKCNDEFDLDLQNAPEKWTNFEGKSCKVLKMNRIFPKAKGEPSVSAGEESKVGDNTATTAENLCDKGIVEKLNEDLEIK
jgi:TFIIIC subunit triple barrel domain